jgi:hypothetical protein
VARRDQGDADALLDRAGCRAVAKDARESFEAQLAKERSAGSAAASGEEESYYE